MNGARGSAVKQIMKAIENGSLPTDETQRRLMGLIRIEAKRKDGPADEELISACLDLMERLQGREYVEDEDRIAALNQRIADAIEKRKRHQDRVRITARMVSAIAAVLVLVVGLGVPLRWTWFEDWSTPDEQQHVIMGHEITVDMVANAIAEGDPKASIVVSDFSEFEKHLGFNPGIPSTLCNDWVADYGIIRYFSGYVRVTVMYVNSGDPEESIIGTINFYTDVDFAYFSFEQSQEGELKHVDGFDLYVSENVDRTSVCWYNELMHVRLSGNADADTAVVLFVELITGGKE